MDKTTCSSQEQFDRKTVERNRRIHMKSLCFELASLIPPHEFKSSKDMLSQQDQLDHATTYIQKLKEKIEALKETKRLAMELKENSNNNSNLIMNNDTTMLGSKLPVIELRDMGSTLEVALISAAAKNNFMSYEIISIVEQEGAEVVSASFSIVGDTIFQSLHAQVKISRLGMDTSRIYQRLQELIC